MTSISGNVETNKLGVEILLPADLDVGLTLNVIEAGTDDNVTLYSSFIPYATLPIVGKPGVSTRVPFELVNESEKLQALDPKTFIFTKHVE